MKIYHWRLLQRKGERARLTLLFLLQTSVDAKLGLTEDETYGQHNDEGETFIHSVSH
jgi:hypothetical protein